MRRICFCKVKQDPCPKCTKYDWSKTWKLAPNGAATKDKIVASRLQPVDD